MVAAVGALTLFGGGNASGTVDLQRPPRMERPGLERRFMNGSSTQSASTTRPLKMASTTVDVACVGAAVAVRESALGTASQKLGTDVSAAYATRASALATAYQAGSRDQVKASVKSAWDAFKTTTQGAKKSWQSSRESAWKAYREALKQCGKGAEQVADSGNAGTEVQGL